MSTRAADDMIEQAKMLFVYRNNGTTLQSTYIVNPRISRTLSGEKSMNQPSYELREFPNFFL